MLALIGGTPLALDRAAADEDPDMTGEWVVTFDCDPRSCGISTWRGEENLHIRQKGSEVVIRLERHGKVKAEIQGRVLTWNRTYPESGGKTVETGSAELSEDGRSYEGSGRWYWTDGSTDCRGTCSYSATKKPEMKGWRGQRPAAAVPGSES